MPYAFTLIDTGDANFLLQAAWAVGPGAGAIDQVYACSSSLNGEAVLVFVRALCAVSQEELNPSQPADIPRYYG